MSLSHTDSLTLLSHLVLTPKFTLTLTPLLHTHSHQTVNLPLSPHSLTPLSHSLFHPSNSHSLSHPTQSLSLTPHSHPTLPPYIFKLTLSLHSHPAHSPHQHTHSQYHSHTPHSHTYSLTHTLTLSPYTLTLTTLSHPHSHIALSPRFLTQS